MNRTNIEKVKTETDADSTLRNPHLMIRAGELRIEKYCTRETDVVRCFQQTAEDDRVTLLSQCLKIGIAAMRVSTSSSATDFIENRMASVEEILLEKMSSIQQMLRQEIEAKFGKSGEISEYLSQTLGNNGMLATLLDSNQPNSPISKLRKDIHSWLLEVIQLVGKEKAFQEAKQQSPIKGFAFEQRMDQILAEIVRQVKGDTYEIVGNQQGSVGRSKKGDRILTISQANNARVAIEFKNVASLTSAEIHRIAEETKRNRQSEYVIIVVKDSKSLPPSVGLINEFGDHLVLALTNEVSEGRIEIHRELLTMAFHLARIRVISQSKKGVPNFNHEMLRERLGKIHQHVQELSKLDTHVRNCREQLSNIEAIGRNSKSELELEVASLQTLVSSGEKMTLSSNQVDEIVASDPVSQ